jgi:hypothetical protein
VSVSILRKALLDPKSRSIKYLKKMKTTNHTILTIIHFLRLKLHYHNINHKPCLTHCIPQNPSTYKILRNMKNKFSWSISGISGSRMLTRGSQYFELLRPFRLPWEKSLFVSPCIFTCSIQWAMRHSPTARTDAGKVGTLSGSPRILMLVIIIESLI